MSKQSLHSMVGTCCRPFASLLATAFFAVGLSDAQPGISDAHFHRRVVSSGVPAPVGWWNMDDNSTASQSDSSGNGFNCALTGSPTWATTDAGHTAGYQVFNGTSQLGDCGGNTLLKPTTAGTLMGWFKFSSVGTFNTIMSNGTMSGSEANGVNVEILSGKICLSINNGTSGHNQTSGTTTISTGTWYHVAVTWDGTTASVYVNGALDKSGSQGGITPSPAFNYTLGWDGGHTAGSRAACSIDDARVYGSALTAAQINTIYTGGAQ